MEKIKACIIGASGYTGAELIRILYRHENVEIVALAADRNAGNEMADIYQHLSIANLPKVVKISDINMADIDVVFCCLPHGTTQEVIKSLPDNVRVIDLSADFRIYDVEVYKQWYGNEHQAPELQKQAVYGLTEIFMEPIKTARIVACPGCYPTSALLPLIPLLRRGVIENDDIIIDSKSGVTGAGRAEKQASLYCEVNEGVKAYGICNHRHMPEIEQTLSAAAAATIKVNFTPQLVPMNRGIISTIYVKLAKDVTANEIRQIWQDRYADSPFVHVLPKGKFPSTRDVYGTNSCIIAVTEGRTNGMAVIVSVIDNLCKGASGQAVQNMNVMFGLSETAGLQDLPLFP
jgi:N-acetyl-gamma-glutamyl-phosphate reductase